MSGGEVRWVAYLDIALLGVDDVRAASCGLLRKRGRVGRFGGFLLGP